MKGFQSCSCVSDRFLRKARMFSAGIIFKCAPPFSTDDYNASKRVCEQTFHIIRNYCFPPSVRVRVVKQIIFRLRPEKSLETPPANFREGKSSKRRDGYYVQSNRCRIAAGNTGKNCCFIESVIFTRQHNKNRFFGKCMHISVKWL